MAEKMIVFSGADGDSFHVRHLDVLREAEAIGDIFTVRGSASSLVEKR
jgi:glycerol-3-phosphate cytidylyltransferase-like family protein